MLARSLRTWIPALVVALHALILSDSALVRVLTVHTSSSDIDHLIHLTCAETCQVFRTNVACAHTSR
jgi:hypothetical protein